MYTCSICKQPRDGEPKRISGMKKNVFSCADCVSATMQASQKARRDRLEIIATRNQCVWCDVPLTDSNRGEKKGEQYNVNLCVDCMSDSVARRQLEKWVKAIGPDPHKDLSHNTFWRYLNGTHGGKPRKDHWEQDRQAQIIRQQNSAPLFNAKPANIDQAEWEEFQAFKEFKRLRNQQ